MALPLHLTIFQNQHFHTLTTGQRQPSRAPGNRLPLLEPQIGQDRGSKAPDPFCCPYCEGKSSVSHWNQAYRRGGEVGHLVPGPHLSRGLHHNSTKLRLTWDPNRSIWFREYCRICRRQQQCSLGSARAHGLGSGCETTELHPIQN